MTEENKLKELELPEELREDTEDIHDRMLRSAPENISTMQGDIFWDNTRPTAEEKSRLLNMVIPHILGLAFPQYAYGKYLDYHAENKDLKRHEAQAANGYITITGDTGTLIPANFKISTISIDDKPPIEYYIDIPEAKEIDDSGEITLPIKASEPGKNSNVAANTVTILSRSITGVKKITNKEPIKNGTEIESDESLRDRILYAYRYPALSGAIRDYIRWGKEVEGVGNIYPIPEWNGAGTVKVLVTDSNGETANEALLERVRQHIIGDSKDGKNKDGLAPIGAFVTVDTPQTLGITIEVTLEVDNTANIPKIQKEIEDKIRNYLFNINIDDVVVYKAIDSYIGTLLLSDTGIKDYSDLVVNGNTENIKLDNEVARLEKVILNVK